VDPFEIIRRLGFVMKIVRAGRFRVPCILIEEFGETRLIPSPAGAGHSEKFSLFLY